MNAVPMLQACARHQLQPTAMQFQFSRRRRFYLVPTPNLILRSYRDTGDWAMGADGVDHAIIVIKEG